MTPTRPHVVLNMASSVDGKTATHERCKIRLGSAEDRRRMEILRSTSDAIAIGAGTLTTEDPPLLIRDDQLSKSYRDSHGRCHPINVVITSHLKHPFPDLDFFTCRETERLIVTVDGVPPEDLERARRYARVVTVRGNPDGVALPAMCEALYRLGINRLLLEGGGTLNFAMFDSALVDEIYLTLCPFLIGGSAAPTVADGRGFDLRQIRRLRLTSCTTVPSGEVFLRYKVEPDVASTQASRTFRKGYELGYLDDSERDDS